MSEGDDKQLNLNNFETGVGSLYSDVFSGFVEKSNVLKKYVYCRLPFLFSSCCVKNLNVLLFIGACIEMNWL